MLLERGITSTNQRKARISTRILIWAFALLASTLVSLAVPAPAAAQSGQYKSIDGTLVRSFVRTKNHLKIAAGNKWYWYRALKKGNQTYYQQCSVPGDAAGLIAPSDKACKPYGAGVYRFFPNGVAIWTSGSKRITLVKSNKKTYGWTGVPVNAVFSETGQPNSSLVRQFRTQGSVNEELQYRYRQGNGNWTNWASWTLIGGTTYQSDTAPRQFTFSEDLRSVTWSVTDNSGKPPMTFYRVDNNPGAGSSAPAGEQPCDGIPIKIGDNTICIG